MNLDERRRAARRAAFWLALLAIAFYVGFIVISIARSGS
jgi:hypothetical protein